MRCGAHNCYAYIDLKGNSAYCPTCTKAFRKEWEDNPQLQKWFPEKKKKETPGRRNTRGS